MKSSAEKKIVHRFIEDYSKDNHVSGTQTKERVAIITETFEQDRAIPIGLVWDSSKHLL